MFSRGPPYNAYKSPQKKNTVKIDPQKYVLQGSPLNKRKKKTSKENPQKYVLQGSPLNKKKNKKRQKRHSEIHLSGVPPIMPIKPNNKKTQRAK